MNTPFDYQAFKFCPVCGTEYAANESLEKACSSCGYIYFIGSVPSAGGIILNPQGQILLIRRQRNPHKGALDFPAGFCDMHETMEETLIREMKEEVGIEVKNFRFYKTILNDYEFKGIVKKVICGIFIVNVDSNEFKAGDDATSAEWHDLHDFDLNEIKFLGSKRMLEEFRATA